MSNSSGKALKLHLVKSLPLANYMKILWFILMIISLIGGWTTTGDLSVKFEISLWASIILLNLYEKD